MLKQFLQSPLHAHLSPHALLLFRHLHLLVHPLVHLHANNWSAIDSCSSFLSSLLASVSYSQRNAFTRETLFISFVRNFDFRMSSRIFQRASSIGTSSDRTLYWSTGIQCMRLPLLMIPCLVATQHAPHPLVAKAIPCRARP